MQLINSFFSVFLLYDHQIGTNKLKNNYKKKAKFALPFLVVLIFFQANQIKKKAVQQSKRKDAGM